MRYFLIILLGLYVQSASSQVLCYDLEKPIPCGSDEFPRQEGDYAVSNPAVLLTQGKSGTVIDSTRGLIWLGCTLGQEAGDLCENPKAMSWEVAMSRCATLQLLQKRWRLPTVMELNSLLNLDVRPPKINIAFFPDTLNASYWTETKSLTFKSKDKAWFVNFESGSVFDASLDSARFVRCVSGM